MNDSTGQPRSPSTQRSGQTLPPGYIHLGVVQEIVPNLHDFSIDPDHPVVREAGLDPRLFDNGVNVIPHAALGRLLTSCVARTWRSESKNSRIRDPSSRTTSGAFCARG